MTGQQQATWVTRQNRQYAGTGGVSQNNAHAGFVPAFKDLRTGRVEISKFPDGRQAPFHLIDGLPEDWVVGRDLSGKVIGIRVSVISGFVRLGSFYSRQEASEFMEQQAGA